jgi:hypothetical protein
MFWQLIGRSGNLMTGNHIFTGFKALEYGYEQG